MTRRELLGFTVVSPFTIKTTIEPIPTQHRHFIRVNVTSGFTINEKDLIASAKDLSALLDAEFAATKRAIMFGYYASIKDQIDDAGRT